MKKKTKIILKDFKGYLVPEASDKFIQNLLKGKR